MRSTAPMTLVTGLLLGVMAEPGAGSDVKTNKKLDRANPVVSVAGIQGSPRGLGAADVGIDLQVGAAVAPPVTIETDASSRVALAFAWAAGVPALETDLLLLGPDAKITVHAAPPVATPAPDPGEASDETPGGDAEAADAGAEPDAAAATPASAPAAKSDDAGEREPVPFVVTVHAGTYRVVSRGDQPLFELKVGDRQGAIAAVDLIGRYEPEQDRLECLVSEGSLAMKIGDRTVRIRDHMHRRIDGTRVLGARKLDKKQWDEMAEQTTVAGVDVSGPKVKPPPAPPTPWAFDKDNNRHWNPHTGQWVPGQPPASISPTLNRGDDGNVDADVEATTTGGEGSPDPGGTDTTAPTTTGGTDADADAEVGDTTPPGPAALTYVKMTTSKGTIYLELDGGRAEVTVANFLAYVDRGFYDGTIFHRVIRNFMIQAGGFTPDLEKKETDPPIRNESPNGLRNVRGAIAMARMGGQADSATSQFFINVQDNPGLDQPRDGSAYAVFGRVVGGMDVVDEIRATPTGVRKRMEGEATVPMADVPLQAIVIEKMERVTAAEATGTPVP